MKYLFCLSISLILSLSVAHAAIDPGCAAYLTQAKLKTALDAFEDKEHPAELLESVYEVASEHLSAQGVDFEMGAHPDGDPYIWIKPNRQNPSHLNQWAASLWDKHHVRFIYDIHSLTDRGAVASFSRPEGDKAGDIRLPSEAILDANHLSSSLAHEMIHSVTVWHLRRGDDFPFYGRVWAEKLTEGTKGDLEIPGTREDVAPSDKAAKKKKRSYAKYFAFDEINTHYGQSKVLLRRITHELATEAETPKLANSRMTRGIRLSRQTVRLAGEALAELEAKDWRRKIVSLDYFEQDEVVVARLRFVV
ncbi:MAG: hypothetical protein HY075_04185, partial [Deltaproteobacteria bacterium]|nr:hypothetical protein [Deltaproteobacteria bacterium]